MSGSQGNEYSADGNILSPRAFERSGPGGSGGLGSDGSGGSGGMLEARVAKLEADVAHIQRDVSAIQAELKTITALLNEVRTSTATMVERSTHLATREWTLRYMFYAGVFLATLGLGAAGYAPKLQAILGTAPSTTSTTR